jgi:Tfp pilus assembly protein PilO
MNVMKRKRINRLSLNGRTDVRKWGVKVVVVLLMVVLGWQFYWSNDLVSAGRELGALREQSQNLREENWRISLEVANLESLERIAVRAEELGMVSGGKIVQVRAGREMALVNK